MITRSRDLFFLVLLCGLCVSAFAKSEHPGWIDMPYSAYSKENYLVAVGEKFLALMRKMQIW